MNDTMSLAECPDALEHKMMRELDAIIVKSRLFNLADGDTSIPNGPALLAQNPGKHMLMGNRPRLPKMPERPTLMDFFKYRFGPASHLLESARPAVRAGMDEKIVMACLVHDIGVIGFIRADHGYWGAQMVAPYVDEEVSWAILAHQALRFYADESVGYSYPESYIKNFLITHYPQLSRHGTKQEHVAVSAGLNDGAQQGAISKGAQRGPVCCSLWNRGSVPGGGDALALAI